MTNQITQQSNTQESAQNKKTSNSAYFRKNIDDTPFTIVHNEDKKYLLTVGRYLINTYESEEEARESVKIPTWQMIGALATIIAESVNKEIKLNEEELTASHRSQK